MTGGFVPGRATPGAAIPGGVSGAPEVTTSGSLTAAPASMAAATSVVYPPEVNVFGGIQWPDEALGGNVTEAEQLTLVQTTGWQPSANIAGPVSVTPGNTEGNLLVVYAAWTVSNANNCEAVIPSSAVADSVGNFWQLAADSGPSITGARCAIWVCPNALAIPTAAEGGWLSFAIQGYASTQAFDVAEFTGMAPDYYPRVDFGEYAWYSNEAGNAITFSSVASEAVYLFGAGVSGSSYSSNPATITSPAGWSTASTGTAGTSGNNLYNLRATSVYRTAGTGGTVTTAWGFSAVEPVAACMCALTQASYPPAQVNPDYPVVAVEAAFGAIPGDPSAAIYEAGWQDLTAWTLTNNQTAGISVGRGKQYELATPEAGTLSVLLSNVTGTFDPLYPGSEFYSNALNENPCFQQGITGWTALNGARIGWSQGHTFASMPGASSAGSLLVVPNGATSPGTYCEPEPINVNAGISGSAWVYSQAGWTAGANVALNFYEADGTPITAYLSATVAVPAGIWTQVILGDVAPPAGAALASVSVTFQGTPTSAFWVAEAGPSEGPGGLSAGQVREETPIRVTAFWQGRRYPVGSGYVERWPQTWPQLNQWGFSPMVATDQVGVANAVNMPSAVQGEILVDEPYACFPFDEQYSVTTNTINGPQSAAGEADGLIAVNTSRINQQTATYHDGFALQVETGQSLGFLGDSGTGMGTSGASDFDLSRQRGPGALYGPDSGLPSISAEAANTLEMWYTVPVIAVTGTITTTQLLQVMGPPNIANGGPSNLIPGWLFGMGIYWPASTTTSIVPYVQATNEGVLFVGGGSAPLGGLGHIAIQTLDGSNAGALQFYLNGVSQGVIPGAVPECPITGLVFGNASWPYSNNGTGVANVSYAAAYGTLYAYFVGQARLASHYTAGATGFEGDTVTARMGRYLAWCSVALNPGGPGSVSDTPSLGPAYSTEGSSIASALNGDALSVGANWFCNANGNLVVLPRNALYNQVSQITFGDSDQVGSVEVPYEPGTGFDYDNTYLNNITQATLTQGPNTLVAPIEKDQPSITKYFARGPLTQQVNTANAQTAYDRAYWSLQKYKEPAMRVASLKVAAASKPQCFTQLLQTDLAAVATVIRRPVGGPVYTLPVQVQKVQHDIGPGVWDISYEMSPYNPENAVLTTDTGNNVLGDNTLAW